MFLKSVELLGFKSFAEKTLIEFHQGVSAIVGPNGCGKSNIVDAIKWVIGEQSSKSLRADKMEEIIFGGTENYKAMNVAEVTLTIINNDGVLPLDVTEVAIKRRLYRSGESEYFINKNPVRLKEVKNLFYDTGIGKSAYSVMEQGKIDQILSNKPEERRYIFEEAAGITRYKVRAAESERKLQATMENMRQVDGILNEVRKNYENLKRQADNTNLYREYKAKLFEIERDIQLLYLKELIERRDKKEEYCSSKKTDKSQIQSEIDKINAAMEESMDLVNNMESNLIEKQKKLYGIDLEKNSQHSQMKILKERIQELEKRIQEAQLREKTATEKIAALNEELTEKNNKLAELLKATEEIKTNIENFKKDINHFSQTIQQNENSIVKNETEITNLDKYIVTQREDLRKVTDDIVTQLDQRLKEMGYSYKERLHTEQAIEEILGTLKIWLSGKTVLFQDIKVLHSADNIKEVEQLISNMQSQLSDSSQKVEELIRLFTHYKKATPSFLDEFLAPEGIITKKREIDENINNSYDTIRKLKEENDQFKQENKALNKKIDEYKKTLENLRINCARMETQRVSLEDNLKSIQTHIREQEQFLQRNALEIKNTEQKIQEITAQIKELESKSETLLKEENKLKAELADLEKNITQRNKLLLSKEQTLKNKMDELVKHQSAIEKAHVELAEINADIKNVYLNFREKHSRSLEEFEDRIFSLKANQKDLKEELAKTNEKLKKLGHVNLMAPEEFLEVKERYEFLNNQMEDLKKSKENLNRIVNEIKTESEDLFIKTYNKIKNNFHMIFRRLFEGGRAEIKLTDSSNVLESGIDILVQPPGKKLENVGLLSGGERSLTGVALLFATFLVKPSPFCILDEIDAALDDANIGRFTNLLTEFANTSQFIIISHNKRTLSNSNSLIGITMQDTGVSKVIAVKIKSEEAYAKN